MATFIYKKHGAGLGGHIEVEARDDEVLTDQQALILMLDQIDSKLYEIGERLSEIRDASA